MDDTKQTDGLQDTVQEIDRELQNLRRRIIMDVVEKTSQSPSIRDIARQTLDHLNAAILFQQQLGLIIKFQEEAVDNAGA